MTPTKLIPFRMGFCAWYLALVLTDATIVIAAPQPFDWPQWRGPNRDGISRETGLNLDWTKKKPPLLWSFKQAGAGYSSPTIIGTTLYCAGASDGSDFAFALDTETGKLKWKQTLGKEFVQDRGDGPRGSVTVDGKLLWKEKVASNRIAIIPTPIYHDHLVYVTSGYGAGCGCVRLTRDGDKFKTEVVYSNRNIANHHGGVVRVADHIYGHSDPNGCPSFRTAERARTLGSKSNERSNARWPVGVRPFNTPLS